MEEIILPSFGDLPPLGRDGLPKLKFEVKMRILGPDPKKDGIEKAVFVDGKQLDFKIDILRFLEEKFKGKDHMVREQRRIESEFLKAVSDAVGRRISSSELKKAILEGWI
jgi:hypothetical protein